jgi:formylglycine-generating enzyme required for sulfatase activity/tRNA A-37 threonylcarbamoyl transferase component Bud32
MICCINPDCPNPQNPDGQTYCISCGVKLVPILRSRYRLIKPIGQGGFRRTYLAKDIDRLNLRCVVKQLVPNGQGTWAINKAIELFQKEAKQLQQLGQHHQIPSLDAYFEEGNYWYLVQQFIDGDNLLELLEYGGIWQESQVKQMLLKLLPVLKFIHEQKIIHRDIKPENIMRRRSDGLLVLIDFGVSKELSGIMTFKPGTQIGSQGYAPIEQMKGGEAYPASDLFSLGVTAFHLLTGIHPFSLWVDQGYSWTANWRQYLKSSIDPGFALIFDKLLAKDIQQRYLSAEEVLRAFQYQSTPKPGSTPTPPPTTIITPSSRRNFLTLAGLSVVAVSAYGVLNKYIFSSPLPPPSPSPSPHPSTSESSPEVPIKPKKSTNLQTFDFETVTVDARGNKTNSQSRQAQFFTEDLGNGVTIEMISMTGGSFLMGSSDPEAGRGKDERPQHNVTVAPFFMGKYEVMQEQWETVMGNNPSNFKDAKRPVENVTWYDAVAFCQKLSKKTGKTYRLPSEAEWEYACRAGTKTPFYFGETITPDLVNYDGNNPYGAAPKGIYREKTTDVGSFPPNAFGLYDMHGNVWEWCSDHYHPNYNGAPTDGSSWETDGENNRVLRGGSWFNSPVYCRTAVRYWYSAGYSNYNIGFRVALVVA